MSTKDSKTEQPCTLHSVKARIVEELLHERFLAMKKGDHEELYKEQGDIHYGKVNGIDKALEVIEKYVPKRLGYGE